MRTAETVRDAILGHWRADPGRLFVRCLMPDGVVTPVTYADLVARGSQFALALRERGLDRGSSVVIVLPHSPDLFCSFFGAILGAQVPAILAPPSFKLNTEHYRHELEAVLFRISASALVTDAATASHLGLSAGGLGQTTMLLADEMRPRGPVEVPEVHPSGDDLVLLQHSSGSTGLKKGVALSNAAVMRQVRAYAPAIQLRPDDSIASWLPLYHDMGLIACTLLPAIEGVPVTAISPLHWVTRPSLLLQAISDYRCTLVWLPNFAYDFMAQRVRASQLEGVRLDSMRAWINCAEPTIASSHRRFLERYASMGVRADTLWTCYAMAETVFAVTQSTDRHPARIERVDRARFQSTREALPAGDAPALEIMSGGVPLEGTELRVVDKQRRDLPERHVGEVAIRCPSLFSGYFRDPQSTTSALVDGWYYSGDLGYLADGHVFVTGRKKDVIIIAGKNYYPQDIERIVSSVPGIYPGRVVALGWDDASVGTQRLIVIAEVDDHSATEDRTLAASVRSALAGDLDCVIDDLRLVPHMWLLKTSSGKIARAPNLQRYLEMFRPHERSVK